MLVTEMDKARLDNIRNFKPLEQVGKTNYSFFLHDCLLYNIIKFADDEEALTVIDTPEEWLIELYPDAQKFGAHFRDVNRVLKKVNSFGKQNQKVAKLKRVVNERFYSAYQDGRMRSDARYKATYALQSVGRNIDRSALQNVKEKFGQNFQIELYGVLLALSARDLFSEQRQGQPKSYFRGADYSILTSDWKDIFGEITNQDLKKKFWHWEYEKPDEDITTC